LTFRLSTSTYRLRGKYTLFNSAATCICKPYMVRKDMPRAATSSTLVINCPSTTRWVCISWKSTIFVDGSATNAGPLYTSFSTLTVTTEASTMSPSFNNLPSAHTFQSKHVLVLYSYGGGSGCP